MTSHCSQQQQLLLAKSAAAALMPVMALVKIMATTVLVTVVVGRCSNIDSFGICDSYANIKSGDSSRGAIVILHHTNFDIFRHLLSYFVTNSKLITHSNV